MAQQQQTDAKPSDLGTRLISVAVLIPPVMAAVYFGGPYFDTLVLVGGAILLYELYRASGGRIAWTLAGGSYVAVAIVSLLSLRQSNDHGAMTIYWVFVLVWGADTLAYFVGRSLGGPKLAMKISPNKTWSGFVGAILGAAIAGSGIAFYLLKTNIWSLILVSAALGAVSQIGDLLESWFKRRFHRKDMGALIPGHGGLFDRVDGLLAASLVCWLGQETSGKVFLAWL